MFAPLLLLVLISLTHTSAAADVRVTTKFGVVKGYEDQADDGTKFFAFKGIPFAEPPVGKLRFKDPVPLQKGWEGELDGTKPLAPCAQFNFITIMTGKIEQMLGTEDCLYMNIFMPKTGAGVNLPVMVFFYGGALVVGDAESHTPTALLAEDIVLVVVQSRLGFLGFMSTEDEEAPGNFGFKDQTESLRWVRDNIADFGGDPNSVTIFGVSSGSTSVSVQLITEESKGLFHRAILQSGSANCFWSYLDNPKADVYELAKQLNCSDDVSSLSTSELVQCLQDKPSKDIVFASENFMTFAAFPCGSGAVVDGKYLKAHPVELIAEGKFHKVNLMAGLTKNEGTSTFAMLSINERVAKSLEDVKKGGAAKTLTIPESHPNAEKIALDVYKHYFGDDLDFKSKPEELNSMFGDRFFVVCVENTKSSFLKSIEKSDSKAFFYELSYRGDTVMLPMSPNAFLQDVTVTADWVSHGEDIMYLFPGGLGLPSPTSENDKKMSRMIIRLWTNFAKTGNPTPTDAEGFIWEEATLERNWHLDINLKPTMKDNYRKEAVEFWNSLPLPENVRMKSSNRHGRSEL